MSEIQTMQGYGSAVKRTRPAVRRQSHRLEKNVRSNYPRKMIFFDTETIPHRESKGGTRQDFRLGVAHCWERHDDDTPDSQEWFEFGGAAVPVWAAVEKWEQERGRPTETFAEAIEKCIHYQVPVREIWELVKEEGWECTYAQCREACKQMRTRMIGVGRVLPSSDADKPEAKIPASFTHDLRWEYGRVGRVIEGEPGAGETGVRFVVHYSTIPLTRSECAVKFAEILAAARENGGPDLQGEAVLTLETHYITHDHIIGGRLGNLGKDSVVVGRASDN